MAIKTEWEKRAYQLLKAELTLRGLNYEDLRLALEKIGVKKTYSNLAKSISTGKFSFAFFLQCAHAIGIDQFQIK